MKFTRTEWEIIVHRLEVGDAIVEALTDHHPDDAPACGATIEAIEDAIDTLKYNGSQRHYFDTLETIILRECCEGSTWFAGQDDAVAMGQMTRGRALAYNTAANSLESKLNVIIPRV